MNEFISFFNTPLALLGLPTTILEIVGFITGAICVWLNTKQNVMAWFFSIINAIIYLCVFWQANLYADATLQIYNLITSFYGIYAWLHGGQQHRVLRVSSTPVSLRRIFILLFGLGTLLWGYLLNRYTDASLSYLDSGLTIASVVAQWMLVRKYIETWLILIVADLIYTGMFIYKELYLTSVLYFVFTLLAIQGYRAWKKDYKQRLTTN
jgi:nicotinamide mononucleotide transporter